MNKKIVWNILLECRLKYQSCETNGKVYFSSTLWSQWFLRGDPSCPQLLYNHPRTRRRGRQSLLASPVFYPRVHSMTLISQPLSPSHHLYTYIYIYIYIYIEWKMNILLYTCLTTPAYISYTRIYIYIYIYICISIFIAIGETVRTRFDFLVHRDLVRCRGQQCKRCCIHTKQL